MLFSLDGISCFLIGQSEQTFSFYSSRIFSDITLSFRKGNNRLCARLHLVNPTAMTCFSSTLVHLNIRVDTLDDCLYLFDGRLPRLERMIVKIAQMISSNLPLNTQVQKQRNIISFYFNSCYRFLAN